MVVASTVLKEERDAPARASALSETVLVWVGGQRHCITSSTSSNLHSHDKRAQDSGHTALDDEIVRGEQRIQLEMNVKGGI
jgi:hypothetical protein